MQNYKKSKGVIHYLAFFYKSMDLTFFLLVQNHKLCVLIENVNLFQIQGQFHSVAGSCGGTRIYFCSKVSIFNIKIQQYLGA